MSAAIALSTDQRRALRQVARAENHVLIHVVPGADAPTCCGSSGHYTTPSGRTIVRHPKAYGWRTVYQCSTVRLEVGREWLQAHGYLTGARCASSSLDGALSPNLPDYRSGRAMPPYERGIVL